MDKAEAKETIDSWLEVSVMSVVEPSPPTYEIQRVNLRRKKSDLVCETQDI